MALGMVGNRLVYPTYVLQAGAFLAEGLRRFDPGQICTPPARFNLTDSTCLRKRKMRSCRALRAWRILFVKVFGRFVPDM